MSVIPPLYKILLTATNTCGGGYGNDDERGTCSPDRVDDGHDDDADDDDHRDYDKGDSDEERSGCSSGHDDDDDVVVMMI